MTSERFEVPYVAPVTFLAGRSRKVVREEVPGAVAIEIQVIGAAEVREVARGTFRQGWDRDPRQLRCLAHGGRILTPFEFATTSGKPATTVAGFRDGVRAAATGGRFLLGPGNGWAEATGGPLPADLATVLSDARPDVEARIRAQAGRLAIVGDGVYRIGAEPVRNIAPHGPHGLAAGVSYEPGAALHGYGFRLDRAVEAHAAFERATCQGGYKPERWFTDTDAIEVLDPAALEFREDVHNAEFAAREALRLVGEHLAWMPPDVIPVLHALALARAGLPEGTALPEDVDGLLARLDDERGRIPGRLVQLKHVLAIGRDMIAMSLPSAHVARIDAADAEALSGMAPG